MRRALACLLVAALGSGCGLAPLFQMPPSQEEEMARTQRTILLLQSLQPKPPAAPAPELVQDARRLAERQKVLEEAVKEVLEVMKELDRQAKEQAQQSLQDRNRLDGQDRRLLQLERRVP